MMEASHLFSISLRVASGVDFLVGMTEAGDGWDLGAGELVLAGEEAFGEEAGELLLVAEGELRVSVAGEGSVVTDTLGSVSLADVSGAVVSGCGDGVSS